MELRDLPSVFVDGEEVLRADAVCGMFSDDDDGSGDYNGVSGGGSCGVKKKRSFSRGNNCLLQFCENSNSTAITELTTAGVRRNITNSYVCDSRLQNLDPNIQQKEKKRHPHGNTQQPQKSTPRSPNNESQRRCFDSSH